ncbi:MAG: helix-turn-helix domain-containing protein [Lachnospiraceae bacterium]
MLGEQIRQLRLSHNLNQVELAKKLGVSKQSVSNWENDNIMPSIDVLKKICSFFSCSADYLLEINHDKAFFIETTDLTLRQIAHIQEIAYDFQELNRQLKK